MRFGKTLKTTIYPPWAGNYIDYHKLKVLLREQDVTGDGSDSDDSQWTEEDEEAFVQELINVQLDKVNAFQVSTSQQLRERTSACEAKLRPLAPAKDKEAAEVEGEEGRSIASEVLQELDSITNEVNHLEKYSRVNFTGFLKAAKKHDRKRGARYRVRPLLQVRLSQLPFNTEDYSPLVRKLSVMYSFVRGVLSQDTIKPEDMGDQKFGQETYSSYKFWVHSDNILEVKTYILRRLPVLVYNPGTSKEMEMVADDPTITSLYFDNAQFDLYNQKVQKEPQAGSLRLRWTGHLEDKPSIFLEKKEVMDEHRSTEAKVQLKEKHVQEFLNGEYRFDKKVHRMEDKGPGESAVADTLRKEVDELQSFIKEYNLQPMLRANYTRTAFQIPGDDRIRISLDTNLALIREDSLDEERPCRELGKWHRSDIDAARMEYPFDAIRKGEISRFPHALLEIKIRDNTRRHEWVDDLMASHLVKEAPRFSKFVHGVAQLFEDNVNNFPFWMGDLENDIRRDPETAYQQEQERLAKQAEDDMAVGSFLGSQKGSHRRTHSFRASMGSVVSKFPDLGPSRARRPSNPVPAASQSEQQEGQAHVNDQRVPQSVTEHPPASTTKSRLASLFPYFRSSSSSRPYQDSAPLPPGVRDPGTWIKDSGPVRVEGKVWLANQRTFIKWLHVSILLSSLSLGLYNAAGKDNSIARALSIIYTGFALFTAGWGWYIYEKRERLIRRRSGRDLDNMLGPIVVCIGLAVALILNFAFKYSAAMRKVGALFFPSVFADIPAPMETPHGDWQMYQVQNQKVF